MWSHPDALTRARESTRGEARGARDGPHRREDQLPLRNVNVYGADSLSVLTDFTFEATVTV